MYTYTLHIIYLRTNICIHCTPTKSAMLFTRVYRRRKHQVSFRIFVQNWGRSLGRIAHSRQLGLRRHLEDDNQRGRSLRRPATKPLSSATQWSSDPGGVPPSLCTFPEEAHMYLSNHGTKKKKHQVGLLWRCHFIMWQCHWRLCHFHSPSFNRPSIFDKIHPSKGCCVDSKGNGGDQAQHQHDVHNLSPRNPQDESSRIRVLSLIHSIWMRGGSRDHTSPGNDGRHCKIFQANVVSPNVYKCLQSILNKYV